MQLVVGVKVLADRGDGGRRFACRHGGRLARVCPDCDEYSRVETDHDDARDVERSHRRVDEKVGVVERAEGRRLGTPLGVVPDRQ